MISVKITLRAIADFCRARAITLALLDLLVSELAPLVIRCASFLIVWCINGKFDTF